MKMAQVRARDALRCATGTCPQIVNRLVKAAHGRAGDRGRRLIEARRLAVELLAKIDIASAAVDCALFDEEDAA